MPGLCQQDQTPFFTLQFVSFTTFIEENKYEDIILHMIQYKFWSNFFSYMHKVFYHMIDHLYSVIFESALRNTT